MQYFNSNMVRLRAKIRNGISSEWCNFNSNMVRLREFSWFLKFVPLPNFNSNMVRLRAMPISNDRFKKHHFNSNMVRLRETETWNGLKKNKISIPIWYDWEHVYSVAVLHHYFHFNSNMVRLRVRIVKRYKIHNRFQFQYGTIERVASRNSSLWIWYFNSNMVRLRA